MKRFAPFSPGSSSAGAPALRLTLVGLLFSLFLTCTAGAVEPVELSGRFGIRAVNCFYPGPHDNHVDYVLVEEGTQRLIRLVGDEEVFGGGEAGPASSNQRVDRIRSRARLIR